MPTSHTTSSDDRRRRGGSSKKKNRGGGSAAYAPATVTVDQMPPPPPPRRNGKQAEVMPTDEHLWPVRNIKPSVRERCGNMQGSELIRELLRNGLNISSGDDYQLSLDKHLKELVEYSARFPFPGPRAIFKVCWMVLDIC